MEARVGFEPTDGGFADLSLRPLGYRAEGKKYSETVDHLSVSEEHTKTFYWQNRKDLDPQRDGTVTTRASRRNRADSSGGVGQI